MKNSHVISISKPLNLSDLNIRPMEICWSKVKMTSSRWIACCHRRLVQQQTPPSAGRHLHAHSVASADRRSHSPTFVRSLAVQNPSHHLHHHSPHRHHLPHQGSPISSHSRISHHHPHQQHLQDQLFAATHSKAPSYPNGSISTSYQTPPRHRHNGLPSSMSSTNSPLTPSNSSPLSSSSLFELGRKSSTSSSSSSTNSFTLTSDRYSTPSSMKHSLSTIDLPSSHQVLRHRQHYRPRDDSAVGLSGPPMPSIENTITIISPLDGLLINCQTTEDSNCAQISPELNVIAVSNEYWVAFYSIKTNECLGTLQFPGGCLYWTWIKADTVAVVTEKDVFHWSLSGIDADTNYIQTRDFLRQIFSIDSDLRDNQITHYAVDPLFGNWCALSTLYVDDDGEIGGKVQIYSHSYGQSQCIEAHSCAFTSYRFDDSDQSSTLLVAAMRQKNRTWKLHIIELGPIPSGNVSHKAIHHMLSAHNRPIAGGEVGGSTEDIPTHIVCDSQVGLVYLLSKYGSFYICDLETGAPLHFEHLAAITDGMPLFSFAYDTATDSLVAISRSGQVLAIQVSLSTLMAQSRDNPKVGAKVLERIRNKLRKMKRLDSDHSESADSSELNGGGHYLSVTSYDSAHSSGSTTSADAVSSSSSSYRAKPATYHFGQSTPVNGDYDSFSSLYQSSSESSSQAVPPRPSKQRHYHQQPLAEPPFDAEDDDEEITRL